MRYLSLPGDVVLRYPVISGFRWILMLAVGFSTQVMASESPSPLLERLRRGERLMFIGAHPDDELAVAPLLARAADTTDVMVVCMTNGGGGQNRGGTSLSQSLGEVRAQELDASCRVLGVEHTLLAFQNDIPVEERLRRRREGSPENPSQVIERWRGNGHDLLEILVEHIRRWKPNVVIGFDPDQGFTSHKEHRAAGSLALAAVQKAGDPGHRQTELSPWSVKRMYAVVNRFATERHPSIPEIDSGRIVEVISGEDRSAKRGKSYIEIGMHAMSQHQSQFGGEFLTAVRRSIFHREMLEQALTLEYPPNAEEYAQPDNGSS